MDRAGRVEGNVRAFLLEMGRAGGGVVRDDPEITWVVGGSPIGYHNAVVAWSAPTERAEELAAAWAGELDRQDLPGSVHLSPSMRPLDLHARLLARGFEDGGEEPGMAADLAAVPEVPPVAGLEIARVRTAGDLDEYRTVLASGFGEGPPEASWVTEVFRTIGLGDGVPWRHLVGRLDGAPVATATLFTSGEVAGLYFVCTTPEVRRRGIGAAITAAAMGDGRALGCSTAVLGSSPMGHRVYLRLGFEELFRYRLLEREPPSASQRTTSSTTPVSTS